jgi:hypothetical protein
MVPITFDEDDFHVRDFPHTNAFVATANIAGFTVHNILIDNRSSADILFIKPFEQMKLDKCLGKKSIPVSFIEGEKVRT